MAYCKICTTDYVEGTNLCSACGWYLADPPVWGDMPDWVKRSEDAKESCAQKLWSKIQEQHQLLSKQMDQIEHLKAQLGQVNQSHQEIAQKLTQTQEDKDDSLGALKAFLRN